MSFASLFINDLSREWGLALWRASWQGGLALLLAWLMCRAWPKMPASLRPWLWRLAFGRLLLGLLWAAPIELPLLSPVAQKTPAGTAQQISRPYGAATGNGSLNYSAPRDIVLSGDAPAKPVGDGSPRRQGAAQSQTNRRARLSRDGAPGAPESAPSQVPASLNLISGLFLLWLGGTCCCLARLFRQWLHTRRLRSASQPLNNSELTAFCTDLCRQVGLKPPLLLRGDVPTPLLTGLRSVAVILPLDVAHEYSRRELRWILAHEIAHLKRRDLYWNWLLAGIQSVFFFHPIARRAESEWHLAQEMACDALTVRLMQEHRSEYGQVLLKVAGKPRVEGRAALAVGVVETYPTLRRRLVALQASGSLSRRGLAFAAASVALFAALGCVPWRVVPRTSVTSTSQVAPQVLAVPGTAPAARRDARQQVPEMVLQIGHNGPVDTVIFSPDGRLLASSSGDGTIKLWQAASGRLQRTIQGVGGGAGSKLSFSADGETLMSAGDNNRVSLLDVATGAVRWQTWTSSPPGRAALWPDAKTAAISDGNKLELRDLQTNEVKRTISVMEKGVMQTAFSPVAYSSDKRTVAGGSGGLLRLWDVPTGKVKRTLKSSRGRLTDTAFSPDGKLVAACTWDGAIQVWEVATGRMRASIKRPNEVLFAVAFSADGRSLACSGEGVRGDKSALHLLDVATGQIKRSLPGRNASINTVAFSPDGATLAAGSWDGFTGTVEWWNARSGKLVRAMSGRQDTVWAVAASPDGKTIASDGPNRTASLWDLPSGKLRQVLRLSGRRGGLLDLAFARDGKSLAGGANDGTVQLWTLPSGALRGSIKAHREPAGGDATAPVALSPDGRIVASGSADKTIRLWDARTRAPLRTLTGHSGSVTSLVFSPDGTTLFSGAGSFGSSKGEIKQWNAYSGKLERTQPQPDGGVAALALSSDGALLVSANGLQDTLSLWDTRSFKKLRTLGNDVNSEMSTVNTLAFMPGTKLLASGHYDGNIRLWDASTGKLMHTLSGHSDDVTSVAFTSGGKLLVSSSYDGTVRVWNSSTGSLQATMLRLVPTRRGGDPEWVAWTPTGYYDASPGASSLIQWRVGNELRSTASLARTYRRPNLLRRALQPS